MHVNVGNSWKITTVCQMAVQYCNPDGARELDFLGYNVVTRAQQ